jgi:hypothetical protein
MADGIEFSVPSDMAPSAAFIAALQHPAMQQLAWAALGLHVCELQLYVPSTEEAGEVWGAEIAEERLLFYQALQRLRSAVPDLTLEETNILLSLLPHCPSRFVPVTTQSAAHVVPVLLCSASRAKVLRRAKEHGFNLSDVDDVDRAQALLRAMSYPLPSAK